MIIADMFRLQSPVLDDIEEDLEILLRLYGITGGSPRTAVRREGPFPKDPSDGAFPGIPSGVAGNGL
jgi:hypothetical protein